MTSPDIARQLARLSRVRAGNHRVVSCYLKLEPRDRSRGKYLIKVKNRIKTVSEAMEQLDIPRLTKERVRDDLGRIEDHLRRPDNLPSTQAVAIFASKPLDLFESIPLPWVHRSRLAVDRTPLTRELASIEDEFGRLLTVVYDRTSARVFEVTAYNCHELLGIPAVYWRGKRYHGEEQGAPRGGARHKGTWFGASEHDYHSRIREEKHRHFAQIAQHLFALNQRQPFLGVVLGGTGADAGVLAPFLHTYLADRVMGVVKLNPKDTSAAEVRDATLEVRREWERQAERALMDELDEALGTRWAVNGMAGTLRALAQGQVRTLLVGADAAQSGFRCKSSGRLALTERDCRDEGGAEPVLDVVDDALEEALRQRVNVNVIYDENANGRIDGIAGLLRFR
jgi:peptide subunit release factor 1 (eRF1)